MSWSWLLAVCAGCYLLKLAGLLLPPDRLAARPALATLADRLPAALLAALVVTGTVVAGHRLVVDARLAGLVAAAVLLVVRAPLVAVVVGAAAAAAGVRALT